MNNSSSPTTRPALLIIGLLLIAANLRAPITSIAPVLSMIQSTFELRQVTAGILTTLPLLAFAMLSPFSATFARKYGLEQTQFGALLIISIGIALRSFNYITTLYLGTWLLGCGIAVGNVLLPSLIKRDFPHKVPIITGACAVTMGVSAALISTAMVPLTRTGYFSWSTALALTIFFPIIAILLWLPQLGNHSSPTPDTATLSHSGYIWHHALAWQITLYMGINSFLYFTFAGWLPSILSEAGFPALEAGSLHGIMQLATAFPGILLPPFVNRMKNQKLLTIAMASLMSFSIIGFLWAPSLSLLWAICFGISSGAGVLLSLMFIALRSNNSHQAAALSGMVQSIGYLLAACGPFLAGQAHDFTTNWNIVLFTCIGLTFVMAIFGILAGRNIHIS